MSALHHDSEGPQPPAPDDPVPEGGAVTVRPSAMPPPDPSAEGTDGATRICEVALEDFEGPLDLLLHLVRRHELDILDIPIAFVCEKYLEYVEFMRALDLEVAGDYLVMAATLAYLKSRELVPQQAEETEEGVEEDGPDPREQLIARLLEYQKFKDAAYRLDERPMAGRDTFARGQEVELPPVDTGLAPITLFRLAEAYQRVLERARIHKSHEVVLETISVAARMEQLAGLLIDRARFDFEALFLEREWSSENELRSMLVVTLMSVLELVRMGIASVHQPLGTQSILVERVSTPEQAREALAGYDEAISFGRPNAEPAAEVDDEADAESEPEPDAGSEDDADPEVSWSEPSDDLEVGAQMLDAAMAEAIAHEGVAHPEFEQAAQPREDPADEVSTDDGSAQDPLDARQGSAFVGPDPTEAGPTSETPPDAGAFARSVVSEPPPSSAVDRDRGDDEATGSDGDGEEHGQSGEAQASEGSQGPGPGSADE